MFFRKRKYYYYSDSDLSYKEVKFFGIKVIFTILTTVVFIVGITFFVNFMVCDFMNLGQSQKDHLIAENKTLHSRIVKLSETFKQFKEELSVLTLQAEKFRMMVDLPKLEKDLLKVGIGGSLPIVNVNQVIMNKDDALAELGALANQLSREIKLQKESYNSILKKYLYNQKLFASIPALKPMEGYYSVSGFGSRRHPVLGIYRTHEGLDIINDVGTNIYAPGDGVVEFAGRSGAGYGVVLVINHGFGYQTLYAHLSKVLVKVGNKVKRGDLIAKSGRSGLVSGPHLHYEVIYKGIKQNPVDYFFDDISPRVFSKMLANK